MSKSPRPPDHKALFIEMTKDRAREAGLKVAYVSKTGLHLMQIRTETALASLEAAAAASARSAPPPGLNGPTPEGHAFYNAQRADITRWWTWAYPSQAPQDDSGDDEYYSPDAVVQIVEKFETQLRDMRGDDQ